MRKSNLNLIKLLDLKFDSQPERGFQILKSKGVGQTTLLKFLGGKRACIKNATGQKNKS